MFSTRIFTNSEGWLVRNNKFNPLTGIRELRASRARVGTHRGRKGPGAQAANAGDCSRDELETRPGRQRLHRAELTSPVSFY